MNEKNILNAKNKKIIDDSVEAAIYEGNDGVYIDTDHMISLFTGNLSLTEYNKFNFDKAENILLKYSNKLFKQEQLKQKKKIKIRG